MAESDHRKIELIMALRRQGISDQRVLSAMERISRDAFIYENFRDQAYADTALPIACGQTISQPFIVAFMTVALDVHPRMKVLEVGTGSGYQAAILSRLCRRVYTIERHRSLLQEATRRFETLGLSNITTRVGDGAKGWPEQAPFERIMVTAAAGEIPRVLVEQLAVGGIMIMPIDRDSTIQQLVRVEKTKDAIVTRDILPVRFVPLVAGVAKEQ
jgi:protein-L-isoaspartate(D-aspartate) O-methyltransferase